MGTGSRGGRRRDYDAAKTHLVKYGVPKLDPRRRLCEHPACGREVGVYVPAKGDGSLEYYYRHNMPSGDPCPLSLMPVPSDELSRW
jgi:hypothetical protein